MAQTNTGGYLDTDYLSEVSYMGGDAVVTTGMQAEMVVANQATTGLQAEMLAEAEELTGMQAEMLTDTTNATGMQADMVTGAFPLTGMQADMVTSALAATGMQAEMVTSVLTPTGFQALMKINDFESPTGMEALMGGATHVLCGGYFTDSPYMEEAYLGPKLCVPTGMQAEMLVKEKVPTGMQADMLIVSPDDDNITGMQAEMSVSDSLKNTGMQANMVSVKFTSMQASMQLYSIDTLRFLCDFASRGIPAQGGQSWTSVQALQAGDFDADNLNTDIFEERTQTALPLPALWELQCDTGQANTFVDTIYIGDHNFTLGATVAFQASTVSNFASIEYERTMTVEDKDMYFILPVADFPPLPAQYYRLLIQDGTNPDGALKIGIVIFGSSVTFSANERFLNPVSYGLRHFKDTIATEGFTNVSNDRALRKFLSLNFEQLLLDGGNFSKIRDFLLTAKTDLKCLIIPRPTKASALAVFSKLTQLPEEQHYATEDDNWRIDLTLSWDEQD